MLSMGTNVLTIPSSHSAQKVCMHSCFKLPLCSSLHGRTRCLNEAVDDDGTLVRGAVSAWWHCRATPMFFGPLPNPYLIAAPILS